MLLSSQASINEQEVSEYPFNDSDDNYQDEEDEVVGRNIVMVKTKHKKDRVFDANKERKMLLERKPTNNLYISLNGQENFDVRRTSPSPTLEASTSASSHYILVVNIEKAVTALKMVSTCWTKWQEPIA
jgi:hypothetical protein